jgi:2-oxoglutarate ferredoxin oxidoreductase subunit beta
MIDLSMYKVETKATWCPGCGDFAVLRGIQTALASLEINPKDVLVVSGIGCSSNIPGFLKSYGFHGLHGRAVPVATGAKLVNPDLNVIVAGGDGDGYGIGLNHWVHAMRRNFDITYVVMNNQIYGLTTGQASPTTEKGQRTKSTPMGVIELPINPISMALVTGATFVARAFSGNADHLAKIVELGIKHKGFSLVDILSPCVTYNKRNTYQWFRERVYRLQDDGHNTKNLDDAIKKSNEWDAKIPIGVFYEADRPTYEDEEPGLKRGPVVSQPLGISEELGKELLKEFE